MFPRTLIIGGIIILLGAFIGHVFEKDWSAYIVAGGAIIALISIRNSN